MTPHEAAELRARGSRALLDRVTAPIVPCTMAERAAYDSTLVGITHYASHWYVDEDGVRWLRMEPRCAAIVDRAPSPSSGRFRRDSRVRQRGRVHFA